MRTGCGGVAPKDSIEPKVSLFLPTYNHAAFIAECLDSCLKQEYGNFEIVVGDDGSTDETPEIVARYVRENPGKIVSIRSEYNQGIAVNANRILAECSGEFIAFCSGDDVLLPGKLEAQVAFMECNPGVLISYHDVHYFDNATRKRTHQYSSRMRKITASLEMLIAKKSFFSGNSVMVRRANLPKDGFDERIAYSADWLFFMELLLEAGDPSDAVDFFPGTFVLYRRHAANVTRNARIFGPSEGALIMDIIAQKKPKYAKLCRSVKGELYLTYAARSLLVFDLSSFCRNLNNAVASGPASFWRFFLNAARYLRSLVAAWGLR